MDNRGIVFCGEVSRGFLPLSTGMGLYEAVGRGEDLDGDYSGGWSSSQCFGPAHCHASRWLLQFHHAGLPSGPRGSKSRRCCQGHSGLAVVLDMLYSSATEECPLLPLLQVCRAAPPPLPCHIPLRHTQHAAFLCPSVIVSPRFRHHQPALPSLPV